MKLWWEPTETVRHTIRIPAGRNPDQFAGEIRDRLDRQSPVAPDPIPTPRRPQAPNDRPNAGDPAAVGRAALLRLATTSTLDDPMGPSLMRFAARSGHPRNPAPLLAFWQSRAMGHPGLEPSYPWTPARDLGPGSPDYRLTDGVARHWRPLELDWLAREPDAYARRLLDPIVLAEALEFLGELGDHANSEAARVSARLLADVQPRIEGQVAKFIQGDDPWRDTLALWLFAHRPLALRALHSLAVAIGTRYATLARRMAGLVCGTRYPFDGTPLVSASAQLGAGLWTLGLYPSLLPGLLTFVSEARGTDGGWADAGQPADVLTTLVAADFVGSLDPSFDPAPTVDFFARMQEPEGWWRALDPETPWVTGAIVDWLASAGRPFQDRFRWPAYLPWQLDRKTRLPSYAAFGDIVRTFETVPGLRDARTALAFCDLSGFKAFNDACGQEAGDRALALFGELLGTLGAAQAIRDGGDEFLVVGAPTRGGMATDLDRIRVEWPARFVERFGSDAPMVAPRIVVTATTGARLARSREQLGRSIGALKAASRELGPTGVLAEVPDTP